MAKTQKIIVEPTKSTTEKLKELLDFLNIKVVYFVDDENNPTDFDIQIISGELEKIYGLEKESALIDIQIENWDRSLPKEETIESLATLWPEIEIGKKKQLYSQILAISKSDGDNILDFNRATMIKEQFPNGMLMDLSPHQWEKEKLDLAAHLTGDQKALVLFDEDLKHAGGKYSSIRGQDLIVEIKKSRDKDKVLCTLLSRKIQTVNDELNFRDSVISERVDNDLDVIDFFPLAKQRLDGAELFADGIKKALLNNYFESIKKHTVEIIQYSYCEAIKKIKKFDTYDFNDTILKSSVKDGIWEPETILRISDIIFENELKQRMVETDYALKVNSELKFSQEFSRFEFAVPEELQPYSDKLALRHKEFYYSGIVINSLRKPLENGDIFEVLDSQYILVAQACDMAVRKKGGIIGLRTAKVATLLKISIITSDELKKKEKDPGNYFRDKYPLHYFTSGTTKIGIVDFADYLIVDIDLLDLCVFNKDGECKINLKQLENKEYLSKTWESRYDILIERFNNYQSRIFKIRKYLRLRIKLRNIIMKTQKLLIRNMHFQSKGHIDSATIEKEFYPKYILASSNTIDNPVKIEVNGTFSFSTKRIANYKTFGATNLLEKYTGHLSRIAEPHDFAGGKS